MGNRFGFKDVVVLLMLAVLVVLAWLKMVQDDRQWGRFNQIQSSVDQQTRDIAELQRSLRHLQVAPPTPATPTTHSASADPATGHDPHVSAPPDTVFRRLEAAQKLPDYARGDMIVESFAAVPPTLNPLIAQDIYGVIVQAKIIESLGTKDYDTLKVVPLLARSWKIAPDGLSAVVQLRDGVKFSDGEPFTADDVVFSYNVQMDPEVTDGREREYLKWVAGVQKLGPLTVKVTLKKFYEAFDRAMEMPILPEHLYKGLSKSEIRQSVALCMGTGPYRLQDPRKYSPGEPIVLVRNERYWGEPGPWGRVVYRVIEKESTEMVAFRNREIDFMSPVPEQHLQMLKDANLTATKQHIEYDSARLGYSYIGWNERRNGKPTIFADRRVRQAMTMLIDRERLLKELYHGLGTVATGPFSKLSDQYDPSVKEWPYDPARAVTLLKEAGFTRDSAGVLHTPDGKAFEPELTYPAGSDFVEKVVIFIRDNLAKAGINLRLRAQKWPLLVASLNNRDYDAITLRWSGGLETDIEQMFATRSIKDGDNTNSYSNPALDKLIDEAHVTLDRDARMKLWQACHRILHDDQPYTFLMRSYAIGWFDKRIHNIQKLPKIGLNSVSIWPNPVEWYVPKAEQLRSP